MSQVVITTETETLIGDWATAQKNAAHWVARERELRIKLFATLFPEKAEVKGTYKIRLPYDMAMVGEVKINYKVDKPAMVAMMDDPANAVLINDVISHRPEVKAGAFEKLKGNELATMSTVITGNAGLPTLDLKPASEIKKW